MEAHWGGDSGAAGKGLRERLESASGTNLVESLCYEESCGATGLGLGWLDQLDLDLDFDFDFGVSRLLISSAGLGGLEIAWCKVAPLLSRLRALLSWSGTKARALL